MPRCHEIPNSEIHERFTSYWNPASWVSKSASNHKVMAPVPVANSRATSRCTSARPAGMSATTAAPRNGTRTAAVSGDVATSCDTSLARSITCRPPGTGEARRR